MTVLEKITLQKQKPLKVILFKEGIFYKAYNEGTFLLRSKNYKVAVKAYKKIDQQVLSIGFPASVFEKLKTEFVLENFETYSSFTTTENYNTLDYINWKTQIIKSKTNLLNNTTHQQILTQLKNYPLANKTPIEVFVWLAKLQAKI